MAMKEQQRQVYRTARGVPVDMHKLVTQNEMTIAVGNAKVNARGDKLGPNGEIIKRREDILKERELAASAVAPNQISPTVEEAVADQPATQTVTAKTLKTSKKDVSNMDPEGNE